MMLVLPRNASTALLVLALAGCSAPDAGVPAAAASRLAAAPVDRAALAEAVADKLQACSYDGAPVRVGPGKLSAALPSDCRDMVAQIMRFTGLPQNFTVVEAPVPNAAAVILLDEKQIPQRVIAFNKDFIGLVRRATGGNAWAPVSVMAHEIGHHLSGHTITPGGSQPPTELEADKFSGFVLFKMGATLDDAQKAMATLVADGPDGATHPGRGRRLAAIAEGWQQACEQQGQEACATGVAAVVQQAPPSSPVAGAQPAASASLPPATRAAPLVPSAVAATLPADGRDRIPAPGSTPSKFNRFIQDEFGVLDPKLRAELERKFFDYAKDVGIEVVTLLVDDLHGMSANDYAYAMMRQLRVGKLDVGNGAVVVIAPEQNAAGVAMGPGLMLENDFQYENYLESIARSIENGWAWCRQKGNCGGWTENFLSPSLQIASGGKHWEWSIRYQDLGEMLAAHRREFEQRQADGTRFDPARSTTWRKLVRFSGTVTDLDPPRGDKRRFVNAKHEELVGPPVLVEFAGQRAAMLYVDPHTQALMPAGKLEAGRRYWFVARESSLHNDTPQLDLLSYDRLD
jgi:hypothetical protein